MIDYLTPAAEGFAMPAEWSPHAATLMAWPSRRELWGDRFTEAEAEYASVARAIADFEPVLMACPPGTAGRVNQLCGRGVEPLEVPIDDSWARDSGPAFVRNAAGEVAAVQFTFNAWGERWHPYADDARLPERVAAHLGMRLFTSPLVAEGGAFLVDGEGTVITTEQCLLNPNRNPGLSRAQIEEHLRDALGASTIIWLPFGHSLDVGPAGTDGHLDGIAQLIGPGHLLLEAPHDPAASEYANSRANLAALDGVRDARGRSFTVTRLDPGVGAELAYANHYLATGAVIVPTVSLDSESGVDAPALAQLALAYPDRQIVPVPGVILEFGGGGPHCITQQIPA